MIDLNIELDKLMEKIDLDLLYANKEAYPEVFEEVLDNTIEKLIKLRYSTEQELGIQRQRDVKTEKYAAYNEYVEQCIHAVNVRFGKEV